ncbi:(d)CMP kinase [Microbacterium amylolyticum]|uniref:Cytidylate kinase n=1 Tax=Microbacterium amylolyticum TaxID=936337 RepID=A0ABS4ZGA9_9MICO|nr:(d)CMP kinase [Microbacterium amylolyticum]MBP2436083.1 cytidylate kinase [Microbacterium amylolyticum]
MTETFFVGIDGPAGSGKSSVSQQVARVLGFGYLDTGAVYRALAWHVVHLGYATDDETAVAAAFDAFEPRISLDPDVRDVRVGDVDVTSVIRSPETTAAVAGVARNLVVRERINHLFRAIVAEASYSGVVVEGRDITTVVAPDAPARILLTAHPDVRAARRSREMGSADVAAVAEAIRIRDASDATVSEFLTAAEGVDIVDTTHLNFEQSVEAVIAVIDGKRKGGQDGREQRV